MDRFDIKKRYISSTCQNTINIVIYMRRTDLR